MRPRVKNGPLDPLFSETPRGRVSELANLIGVARQTIQRWQKGGTVSKYWQMQIDLIAFARGLEPIFNKQERGPFPPAPKPKPTPKPKTSSAKRGGRRERESRA